MIGRGWHQRAGLPHAEIEAIRDAEKRRQNPKGATLYVTLEPCSSHGRTPPCTEAIIAAGIKRMVVGATDPNPKHSGRAFGILRQAGVEVVCGILRRDCEQLNEAFNHWIVRQTPFVTVKAAMTLDGKIATAGGESKWITGEKSRAIGMNLRHGSDAILVGVNTILADDPALTIRGRGFATGSKRRIILDSMARTPVTANVASDEFAGMTTIVVGSAAPEIRIARLARKANVVVAPGAKINLSWLLKRLGAEHVTSLLVEGGGEVNAAFLLGGLAQRIAFFYAPKILGGREARKVVAGDGIKELNEAVQLREIERKNVGDDLLLTALVAQKKKK